MMNGTDSLIKKIPKVRRARDYHIYDFKGRRFLDLWLDGGRALTGHKSGRTVLVMKNSMEKGLSASYPGVWEGRLLNQLKLLYPEVAAFSVVFSGGRPAFPIFRPFETETLPEDGPFELLLPLPGSAVVRLLCASALYKNDLPVSDSVPQFIYSGLCRAAAELAAFRNELCQNRWSAFDSPLWNRKGPWLYPAVDEADYKKLFLSLLKDGILLSPSYKIPSCAPYRFTEGEIVPIKKLAEEYC